MMVSSQKRPVGLVLSIILVSVSTTKEGPLRYAGVDPAVAAAATQGVAAAAAAGVTALMLMLV